MQTLAEYQASFTAHLRDPKHQPKPKGVNDKRMGVYREIVFNNIEGAVAACYPVLQSMLGKRKWQALCRGFFAEHHHTSPLFRDIPQAFLDYLQNNELAPALKQLAHYEWAELAVSHLPDVERQPNSNTDLLDDNLALIPAHLLVHYDYPVHLLSKRNPPSTPEDTFILIHRNVDYEIKFTILNALTYQLLQLIQQGCTGRQALSQIAQVVNQSVDRMIAFGETVLEDFQQQGLFCEYGADINQD